MISDLMKKSKVKTIKNEKFALSQSLLDCLEIEQICRRQSSFCKCVLGHSIYLFWFRIEAIEDMRSGESCLKTFCGRSLTDVCDMMGHNSWENWMAMVAGMVLHLTVFPLIVKVESPSYFQKTNILDSFAVSIFVQGGFFNCSAQFSVLKRKMLFNQRGSFVYREFHGTESFIDCPSFFILVLKIGRNS